MAPAKEVGGDFYDFFLIDDDHLGLVMADVSGKGVPAALFMMISKILVQNYAMTGLGPAEVLKMVNDQICANNREEMFVTVWFGVLDIQTGTITAANADKAMFGTEQMLEALNRDSATNPKEVLQMVQESVDAFVGSAEQFDDLTMLCMEYRGKQ